MNKKSGIFTSVTDIFPTFAGKKEYFYNNYRFKNLQT